MAELTINIPDAAVARIRQALGHLDTQTQQWVPATAPEVLARIKGFLKSQVIEYEVAQTAIAVRQTKSEENWDG